VLISPNLNSFGRITHRKLFRQLVLLFAAPDATHSGCFCLCLKPP